MRVLRRTVQGKGTAQWHVICGVKANVREGPERRNGANGRDVTEADIMVVKRRRRETSRLGLGRFETRPDLNAFRITKTTSSAVCPGLERCPHFLFGQERRDNYMLALDFT